MPSGGEGYEDNQFESAVPENFHCAICLNVLKQPMQCVRNEHSFCNPCILRHLRQQERCPSCMERLTLQTLRPSRVITDIVSQLNIKCDNVQRGCPDIMKLEMLEAHVRECGFSPVKCSNDVHGCKMVVNRKDELHHEKYECQYRKSGKRKCEDCSISVPYAKRKLHCYVTRTEMNEVRGELSNMKEMMMTLRRDLTCCMNEMRGQMGAMKVQLGETNHQVTDLMAQVGAVKLEVDKCKKEIQESQSSTHSLNSPVTISKQNANIGNDIIIAGGHGLKSVEMFSWKTRQWTFIPRMVTERPFSSSFVHQRQIFICGGQSDSMEVLQLGEIDAEWKEFPAKLPKRNYGQASVVYEENLFIFGGERASDVANDIYKVSLLAPDSFQSVCSMPEPRAYHGAQQFGDKVVVAGGTTTCGSSDSLDTVLAYDITNNCCQTLAPLPFPVCHMATVAWKDNIIILGGRDENCNELNTVISYNVKEEKSKMLPPMKHKRSSCTAIITGNVIVVMGGNNSNEGDLNSVECFNVFDEEWADLPSMKEKRWGSTAVVKCDS